MASTDPTTSARATDGPARWSSHTLTATDAAARIRLGELSPVALVEVLLARIKALDEHIRAWVAVDPQSALDLAEERERQARSSQLIGSLHGVPVGVKDIFDVAGMATRAGAPPFAHRRPTHDAAAVARLRRAGAIVVGKTVTTPFAFLDAAETRNPWSPEHTPGGSSSGSAAAVAAGMTPCCLGSQTIGSTLRPAAYCGIVGFKPAHGRISCRGMVPLAPCFDHVGILCRSVADAAAIFDVLAGPDPEDPYSLPDQADDVASLLARRPQAVSDGWRPRLGLPRQLLVDATPDVVVHLRSVTEVLARAGATVEEIDLPQSFVSLVDSGLRVLEATAAAVHAERFATQSGQYPPKIRALIEAGLRLAAVDYLQAEQRCRRFREDMRSVLPRLDALLMPVADSTAPKGVASTGDPRFCAPWSFTGLPAIAIPSGLADNGLPLSVQLVSASESKLLTIAAWCEELLAFSATPSEGVSARP